MAQFVENMFKSEIFAQDFLEKFLVNIFNVRKPELRYFKALGEHFLSQFFPEAVPFFKRESRKVAN